MDGTVELMEEIELLGFLFVFNLLESDCARLEVPLVIESEEALC